MANTLTSLVPTELIADASIQYLANRAGMAGKIYKETIFENELAGGYVATITKPMAIMTPVAKDYDSVPNAQNIVLPSMQVTVDQKFENKVKLNEWEQRIARGGQARLLRETIPGMMDGLITKVDASIFALYSSLTQQVGTYNAAFDDDVFTSAVQKLMDAKVPVDDGNTNLVLKPKTYIKDLMQNARYTLALNIGDNGQALKTGVAPNLYGVNIKYSHNVPTQSISTVTTAHNILFDKYAFVIAFVQFEPAKRYGQSAPVEEEFRQDPITGIPLRFSKYYDANAQTWFFRVDCQWGTAVLDANRAVDIISKVE